MSTAIQIHPEVAALAKHYGFEEVIEMGGAYLSKELGNTDVLTIGNGEADFPDGPDAPISWSLLTYNGDLLEYGTYPSLRNFLAAL